MLPEADKTAFPGGKWRWRKYPPGFLFFSPRRTAKIK